MSQAASMSPPPSQSLSTTPGMRVAFDAPVARVTLLEDRAQVGREGKLQLAVGRHRLKVAAVSPVISDRSLVARGPAGVRIDEARLVRTWRIGAIEKPEDAGALHAEQERVEAERQAKQELVNLLEQRRGLLAQATGLLIEGINRELPFAKAFDPQWALDAEAFFESARKLDPAIQEGNKELRELDSRLAAVQLRLATFGRVDHVLAAEVELDLTVETAGEHLITVDYMVPCALWRPTHRATLGDDSVRFECEGAVWQATGEDWREVALSFSTARSTQRAEPPLLREDRLRLKKREDKRVEVALHETTIQNTGEGAGESSDGSSAEPELPGVDDGGETRLLGAAAKATILSDGRMVRVPIFFFEAKAEIDRIARPELGAMVHLRSRQDNPTKLPLLAGPLELLRRSGYVGRSKVLFVAPGERFAIGWGPDDALRIQRKATETRETAKLTGKQTLTRTVELYLSNLGDAACAFTIEERVPVSELEQVSIELDAKETHPAGVPDAQGICAWKVQLAAHGTEKISLVYRLITASDVTGI